MVRNFLGAVAQLSINNIFDTNFAPHSVIISKSALHFLDSD